MCCCLEQRECYSLINSFIKFTHLLSVHSMPGSVRGGVEGWAKWGPGLSHIRVGHVTHTNKHLMTNWEEETGSVGATNKRGAKAVMPELSSYCVAGGNRAQLFAQRRSGKENPAQQVALAFHFPNIASCPTRLTQQWNQGGPSHTPPSRTHRTATHREARGVHPEQVGGGTGHLLSTLLALSRGTHVSLLIAWRGRASGASRCRKGAWSHCSSSGTGAAGHWWEAYQARC